MSYSGGQSARLVEYVERLLAPGQSIRAFCAEHPGLDNARISAWRNGSGVSIEQMREFGDALGLRLGQVMVIAEYGTPEDFGEGAVPPEPVRATPPTVAEAIETDPTLTEHERTVLRAALDLVRQTARTGRGGKRVVR